MLCATSIPLDDKIRPRPIAGVVACCNNPSVSLKLRLLDSLPCVAISASRNAKNDYFSPKLFVLDQAAIPKTSQRQASQDKGCF
jgi:hypothetical protein